MLDTKIINGSVIDGSGASAYRADVGIRDGRIVAIGTVPEGARETIDAAGRSVAPGFVDSHTHYDAQVFWDPFLTPSCYHGVTTILGGNCGFSIAPLTNDGSNYLASMLARVEGMPLATLKNGVPWDWTSFGSYLDKLEGNIGINTAFFVGHCAVRRAVMGERAVGHKATPEEIEKMKHLVAASLGEGAVGFSTTISASHNDADGNPVPSRHASRDELLALASVCRDYEGTTLELLPNIDFDPATVDLLTDFSLAGQRPVNWNVLMLNGSSDKEIAEARRQLAVSDYANSKGAAIKALMFVSMPTMRVNFWTGFVLDFLPGWAPLFRMSKTERIERLRDREYRQYLDRQAKSKGDGLTGRFSNWGQYIIKETFSAESKPFEGMTVAEIAAQTGKAPFDAMIDIVVADGLKTSLMLPTGIDDHELYRLRAEFWKHKNVVVGASDAGAHMDMIDAFAFSTLLLQKGVREHQVISLEEAVHQLTEVPAEMIGLRERGKINLGWHADIVVFDPHTVARGDVHTRQDLPGGEGRLYADAVGMEHVMVNGTMIVRNGKHTGAKPGKVLRSGQDTYTVRLPMMAA